MLRASANTRFVCHSMASEIPSCDQGGSCGAVHETWQARYNHLRHQHGVTIAELKVSGVWLKMRAEQKAHGCPCMTQLEWAAVAYHEKGFKCKLCDTVMTLNNIERHFVERHEYSKETVKTWVAVHDKYNMRRGVEGTLMLKTRAAEFEEAGLGDAEQAAEDGGGEGSRGEPRSAKRESRGASVKRERAAGTAVTREPADGTSREMVEAAMQTDIDGVTWASIWDAAQRHLGVATLQLLTQPRQDPQQNQQPQQSQPQNHSPQQRLLQGGRAPPAAAGVSQPAKGSPIPATAASATVGISVAAVAQPSHGSPAPAAATSAMIAISLAEEGKTWDPASWKRGQYYPLKLDGGFILDDRFERWLRHQPNLKANSARPAIAAVTRFLCLVTVPNGRSRNEAGVLVALYREDLISTLRDLPIMGVEYSWSRKMASAVAHWCQFHIEACARRGDQSMRDSIVALKDTLVGWSKKPVRRTGHSAGRANGPTRCASIRWPPPRS